MTYEEFTAKHAAEREGWDSAQKRCSDCCYLVEDDNGRWICDNVGKEIHSVTDREC